MIYQERLIEKIDDAIVMAKNTLGEANIDAVKAHYNGMKALLDLGVLANPKDIDEAIDAFEKHDPEYLAEMYKTFNLVLSDEGHPPKKSWLDFIAKVESGYYGETKKTETIKRLPPKKT